MEKGVRGNADPTGKRGDQNGSSAAHEAIDVDGAEACRGEGEEREEEGGPPLPFPAMVRDEGLAPPSSYRRDASSASRWSSAAFRFRTSTSIAFW